MVTFIKSASKESEWINDDKIEICFIGRSNVGKSTLINALAKQKISRTSNTPGRTQLVNFFDFGKYRLIDLPGYGYAKVNKDKKEKLNIMIEEYLVNRKNLYAVFQICDCNVLTDRDQSMARFLKSKFNNHYIILNKIDKQSKSFYDNNINKIAKYFNTSKDLFIPLSAKKSSQVNLLEKKIDEILKNR